MTIFESSWCKNFIAMVAEIFGDLLGYFESHHFLSKTAVDTFWSTLGKIGLHLILSSGFTVSETSNYACWKKIWLQFVLSKTFAP